MKCDSDISAELLSEIERARGRKREERNASSVDALPSNTYNFRCLSNNNGRKRMKMDWKQYNEKVTKEMNETTEQTNKPTKFVSVCQSAQRSAACTFRHYFVFYRE